MKIIQVCTAESLGGLELYFASCCQQLHERGHQLLAVVTESSKLHTKLKNEVDCFPVRIKGFGPYRTIISKVRAWRPDIVHVHHKEDLLLGALLKKFAKNRFRYVHTRQMDFPRNKKNPYHTFLYRSIDLMIAITDRLKNQMIEHLNVDPKKIIRLYYGVPLVEAKPERCKELGIHADNLNIGVIARIDRKKDQMVLIEALCKLQDPTLRCYLIGGITDREYQQKLETTISQNDMNDQVVMAGFMENPQELMPCFDIIVLTTGNETFGLVLPEAMRMRVAVIGANGGGVPEILEHNVTGLMFEPGDAEDLSKQIDLLKDKPTRKRIAESGRLSANERFEIDQHFDQLENIFEDLVRT